MKFLSNILVKAGLIVEGTTNLQGTATALTPATSDNTTKIATTAFVKAQGYLTGSSQLDWNNVINRPTTLSGYGITDPVVLTSGSYTNPSWIVSLAWNKITGTPTSLSGYGITDPVVLTSGSYTNPSWIVSLAWSKITGTPTSLAGYGITDPVVLTSGSYSNPSWIIDLAWSKITGTPTTLSGYGITDGVPSSRTITINGTSQDLSANRTFSVGTVTSVALSAPTGFAVTGSPITSSGTLALSFSSGYSLPTTASQTNWDTAYTNRITSLTTTGSSGAATLISNTLNIPNYTLAGLGGISLTSLSASAPLSYNNTTGAFSISQSNTTTDGYLSSTDWNTFNGKIGGSGTSNYVPKFTATSTLGNSQIFDNGTNVGINTATPSEKLEVSGILRVSRTTSASVYLNVTAESGNIIFDARGSSDQIFHTQTLERLRIGLGGDITISTINNATIDTDKFLVSDSGVIKYRTGSEILSDIGGQGALTLTTTGTSGAATLVGNTLNIPQYSGGGGSVSGTTNYIAKFTSSTAVGDSRFFDNGTVTFLGNGDVNATPSTGIFSGTGGTGTNIAGAELRIRGGASTGNAAGGIISFYTSAAGSAGTGVNAATERARFTTAGNLGIGTNTSAWGSVFRVLELGNGASIYNWTGGNLGNVTLSSNAYEDASLVSRYINTNGASTYLQNNGEHRWSYAASGTAGAAITYTVGMNLNSSGNLGINTTTIGSRLQVNGNAAIGYSASTAAPTNGLVVAGSTGIGTASPNSYAGYGALTLNGATNGGIIDFTTGGTLIGEILNVSTDFIVSAFANVPLSFRTNNVERGRFLAGGGLIIGNGETAATPTLGIISGTGGTGSNVAGAEFRIRGGASTGSGAGGPITFYTSAAGSAGTGVNAGVERMRILSNGNIVIGNNTTTRNFEVYNNGLTDAIVTSIADNNSAVFSVFNNGGTSGNFLQMRAYGNTTGSTLFGLSTNRLVGLFSNGDSGFGLGTIAATNLSLATNNTVRMTITSGGSIGIATTTIGSTLQVNGNAAIGYSASTGAPTNGLAVAGNIGVGTTTAADMVTVGTTTTGGNVRVVSSSYGTNGIFRAYGTDGNEKLQMGGLANTQAYIYTPASIDLLLFTGAAERARLNASGVFFIGNGETAGTPTLGIISATGGTGTNIVGAEFRIRGGASTGNASGGPITFYTSAAGTAGTGVNAATEVARFDTRGNLGINTTPQSWGTSYRAIQIGQRGGLWAHTAAGSTYLSENIWDDGSASKYIVTGLAAGYQMASGAHYWYQAASGTAGANITLNTSMFLNTSNNLGIGTTTIGSRLQVNGNAAIGYSASTAAPTNGLQVAGDILGAANIRSSNGTVNMAISWQTGPNYGIVGTFSNHDVSFWTNNSQRMLLTTGGNLGLGVIPSSWASGFRAIQIGARSAVYNSDINFTGLGNNIFYDGSFYRYITTAAISTIELGAGVITFGNAPSGTAGAIVSGSERMRIDASGNLGLGIVPTTLWQSGRTAMQIGASASIDCGTTSQMVISSNRYFNGTNDIYINTAAAAAYQQLNGVHAWFNAPSGTAGTTATMTERMRLDASGNVGLGVTPSAWGSVFRVLQLGNGGSIYNWTGGNLGNVTISSNSYEDASLVSRYINTNGASSYLQNNGEHRWSYAASGTAGNAITYTVGMNLNNSGNLGINTTTIGSRLQVNGNAAIGYSASTAAPTNGLAVNGLVGIGTTSPKSYAALTVNGQLLTFNNLLVNAGNTIKLNAYFNSATVTDKAVSAGFAGDYFLNNSTGSLLFRSSATSFAADADVTLVNRMEITSSGEMKLTPSANTAMLSTTGAYSLTGSNASSLIDLAGTWNTTGNPTAIKLNITNTASGANSLLMDLQVGGTPEFRVTRTGSVVVNGSTSTYQMHVVGTGSLLALGEESFTTGRQMLFGIDGSGNGEIQSVQQGTSYRNLSLNPLGGNVGIATSSPTSTLHANGSVAKAITTKTATYTLTSSDHTVIFNLNGNATANLPDATTCTGRIYMIKINRTNVGNTLTIDPNGTQTIDGFTTYSLQCQYAVIIQSDGSNWQILGDFANGTNCL